MSKRINEAGEWHTIKAGATPSVGRFQAFESKEFGFKPKDKYRRKFHTKGNKGILVSHRSGNAYRLLLRSTKPVFKAKDVNFNAGESSNVE